MSADATGDGGLGALIEGLSNNPSRGKLEISQHTVKFHVESLFRKLEVNSRSQAVIKGLALISQNRIRSLIRHAACGHARNFSLEVLLTV